MYIWRYFHINRSRLNHRHRHSTNQPVLWKKNSQIRYRSRVRWGWGTSFHHRAICWPIPHTPIVLRTRSIISGRSSWRFGFFQIDTADPPFPRNAGYWWFGCRAENKGHHQEVTASPSVLRPTWLEITRDHKGNQNTDVGDLIMDAGERDLNIAVTPATWRAR